MRKIARATDTIFVEANGQAFRDTESSTPLDDRRRDRMEDWDEVGEDLKGKGWEHRPGAHGLAQSYHKPDPRGWEHELHQGVSRSDPDEISWVHVVHLPEGEGPSQTKFKAFPEMSDAARAAERMVNGGSDFTGYHTRGF
jgi:hypothetical protein